VNRTISKSLLESVCYQRFHYLEDINVNTLVVAFSTWPKLSAQSNSHRFKCSVSARTLWVHVRRMRYKRGCILTLTLLTQVGDGGVSDFGKLQLTTSPFKPTKSREWGERSIYPHCVNLSSKLLWERIMEQTA